MYQGETIRVTTELKVPRKTLMLYPYMTQKLTWDIFIASLKMFYCLSIPYRLSFWSEEENSEYHLYDIVIDFFLYCDVLITFFTAYMDDIELIEDRCEIAKNYLKGQFIIDFLGLIPLFLVNGQLLWLRVSRLLQVTNFPHKLENSAIASHSSSKPSSIDWQTRIYIGRFLKIGFYLVTILHFVACMFHLIASEQDYDEGNPSTLLSDGLDNTQLYVKSIYWTITTFSTVGYGDISAVTEDEMLFVMGVELMGILLFAYLIGNVTSIISSMNERENAMSQKQTDLDKWLLQLENNRADHRIDRILYSEIRNFFTYVWKNDHSYLLKDTDFMMRLPIKLRRKLTECLFSDEAEDFGVFFKGCPSEFRHDLVLSMYPRRYKEEEDIVELGSRVDEMYFITKGSVLLSTLHGVQLFLRLPTFSFFGEEYIIFDRFPNMSFIADINGCECFTIGKTVLLALLKRYTVAFELVSKRAFKRSLYFEAVMKANINKHNHEEMKVPGENRTQPSDFLEKFNFDADLSELEEQMYQEALQNVVTGTGEENKHVRELEESFARLNRVKREVEGLNEQLKKVTENYEHDMVVMKDVVKLLLDGNRAKAVNTLNKL